VFQILHDMLNSGGNLKKYAFKSFGKVKKDKRNFLFNSLESMQWKFFETDLLL